MARATELFAAITCLVFGLSHLLRPRESAAFIMWLRGLGYPGVYLNGMISLLGGAFIVSFHNVWTGLPTVLTVMGWMQVLKGTIIFVFPKAGLWSLSNVSADRMRGLSVAGAVLVGLSGVFFYCAWQR